jgi:outer membrane lipoprotein-sorting protein
MVLLLLLLSIRLSAQALPDPLDPLLARLEQASMLVGSFVRTDHWALTMQNETSRGEFSLCEPDLFLLDYFEPEGRMAGYDGERLYTVEPESRQVVIFSSGGPGSFLHRMRAYADSGRVAEVEIRGDSVEVTLEGELGRGIRRIEVGFLLSDSLPYLFSSTDANGNRTTYHLDDLAISSEPDSGALQMTVPDGYEIVRSEG